MPRKRQGLRSYHHKSRNGCSNCKRRRVKCSMQAPACANCIRRNEFCEYQALADADALQWPSELEVAGNAVEVDSFDFNKSLSTIYGLVPSMLDADPNTGTNESNTTSSIAMSASLQSLFGNSWFSGQETSLWVPAIERQSRKYPYIQHCFFSLIWLTREAQHAMNNGTPVTAFQHHIAASSLFRQFDPAIDENNWIAVMLFGICMLVFQISTQMPRPDSDFNIIDTLRVLRGTMAIIDQTGPHFRRSPFWPLILRRTQLPSHPLDAGLKANFQSLAKVISDSMQDQSNDDDDEECAEINRQAFWELREWTLGCEASPRRWEQYCHWPSRVTPEYLELLADKDDIALLIFIHWCAIMFRTPKWFLSAWAKRAAFLAVDHLHGDWGHVLSWPLRALFPSPQFPIHLQPLPPVEAPQMEFMQFAAFS
ncbi:hypothetical protein BDV95DRAFT_54262 [Massariosphaeria phaeospora]|uniref:Zn(2)-C6 fungal-type domain-containing protein n=1 Tax=Massariosphaeria phaeospora TaxID=100035 RepID=A0A7C8I550_9PLEO|nr:hypothetical protein BDV95DRAFT_54262 [Massariosphaeria phaeospora]